MSRQSEQERYRSRTSRSSSSGLRAIYLALDREQRIAGMAALALAGSVFLPWWHDPILDASYVGVRRLTFAEVALFLVAASVVLLLVRRGEGKVFHLPLSDATLIAAAGFWATFLVLYRMIDTPTRTAGDATEDYGIRWGLLVALAAAILLAVTGVRERRKRHAGESEAVAADADAVPTELPGGAADRTVQSP
jgi:hypothetical protein